MKILMGTHPVPALRVGGLYTQILNTKKYLERMGVSVQLFNGWEAFDPKQVDLFHLFWANRDTHLLGITMKEEGLPVVISPIFYSRHKPWILSWIHTLGKGMRPIKSIHQGHVVISELCRLADMNLPNTRKEALLLEKGLGVPREKIRVIPNGVEERFYHADPSLFKKRYNLENFILYVGHIGSRRKNTLKLLRALHRIDHPAVLIGPLVKGSYSDHCMEESKKNKNLLILPGMEGDSPLLESAYAASSLFVLPSLFETPGIAALEAGLAGAKIVITRYGGTEEYFGKHAHYVNPLSVHSIFKGITIALNQKKDTLLREHIRKNYLWEIVSKETLQVYRDLLKGS